MADERDRLRARLGLAPLPTGRTDSAASVDERTQARAKTLTADQLEARQAQAQAAEALDAARKANIDLAKQLGTTVDPKTGKIIPKGATGPTGPGPTGPGPTGPGPTGPTGPIAPAGTDPALLALLEQLRQQNLQATLAAQAEADRRAAAAQAERQSAYDLLYQQFNQYGLGALVEPLKGFITSGISPSEFTIRLRETDAYKKRFAANPARISKGLRALSEAEYIGLEDQYQDVMRRYGLPESYYTRGEMGRQEGFEKFIAGDVSPVELEDRLGIAYKRVKNAPIQVFKTLEDFFPEITNGDLLAYMLDPNNAIENIKRKVGAAEIGAGAMQAGLKTGLARAEELQRYGVTKEAAQQGFGTIASGLERGRQLSSIYQQPTYTQEVAETEVFALPDAEKARRQRRRLGQLETATFSGTTGMTGGALDRERAGQY
jgi:hypothetical protein